MVDNPTYTQLAQTAVSLIAQYGREIKFYISVKDPKAYSKTLAEQDEAQEHTHRAFVDSVRLFNTNIPNNFRTVLVMADYEGVDFVENKESIKFDIGDGKKRAIEEINKIQPQNKTIVYEAVLEG